MKKAIKIFVYAFLILAVSALIAAVSIYVKYRSIEKENISPAFIKSEMLPSDETEIGEKIRVVYTIQTPWNKRPELIKLSPADGSEIIGKPQFIKLSNSWGFSKWNAVINLTSFETGFIQEGSAQILFSAGVDGKKDALDLKIPSFTSSEMKNVTEQPLLANREQIPEFHKSKTLYYALAAAIIIILALILFIIFRRKKNIQAVMMPWEKAILSLNSIKIEFIKGELQSMNCFLKLTDTIRLYLEERFDLHAPKQTTHEFMNEMENPSSPLSNKDRNFLRDFMRSGDMIKFAMHDADRVMIENSIDRALLLIQESIPEENNDKQKQKESHK